MRFTLLCRSLWVLDNRWRSKVIHAGTRQSVSPGDIIVIPPHTAHGFAEITTERIVYTVIRVDPQRLLELSEKAD
jgi:mannose-6-phosphate isomerase-like protein (cupin superfamily)